MVLKELDRSLFESVANHRDVLCYFCELLYGEYRRSTGSLQAICTAAKVNYPGLDSGLEVIAKEIGSTIESYRQIHVEKGEKNIDTDSHRTLASVIQQEVLPHVVDDDYRYFLTNLIAGQLLKV